MEFREVDVIQSLLKNHGAQISQATLAYLVDQSASVDEYQEPLLRRRELGPELAKRMYVHVSTGLRNYILAHFQVDRAELDARLAEATSEALEKATSDNHVDAIQALADKLAKRDELTYDLIVQTLRRGEVQLFEAMMAQMTSLPRELIPRLLYEEEADGFVIVARVAGFDRSTFTTLFLLLQRAHPHHDADDPQQLRRGLELFDRLRPETAKKWRRACCSIRSSCGSCGTGRGRTHELAAALHPPGRGNPRTGSSGGGLRPRPAVGWIGRRPGAGLLPGTERHHDLGQ